MARGVEQLELFTQLESLPWQVLYNEAISNGIVGITEDVTKEMLIDELIDHGVDAERLRLLLDRYAYGKIVTFSLWRLAGDYSDNTPELLQQLVGVDHEVHYFTFRRLRLSAVTIRGNRVEVIYTYSKRHVFLNEEGVQEEFWEQRIGSAWVGTDQPYLAVLGRDERVWTRLAGIIADALGRPHTPIRPPQRAIDRCFEGATRSRVTYVSPDGERTTISRTEGLTPEQEEESQRLIARRRRVAGGFKASIGQHENVAARFNATKGTITIQKSLPAEELFLWTEEAIRIILEETSKIRELELREVFDAYGKEVVWSGIPEEYHPLLETFLANLLRVPYGEPAEFEVTPSQSMVTFLENSVFFFGVYRPHCPICDSPVGAVCSECLSTLSIQNVKNRQCPEGHSLIEDNEYRIICPEGHKLPMYNPQHCWYLPTPELCKKIDRNLQQITPGSKLAFRWYIAGMQMVVQLEEHQAQEIPFGEIMEFYHDGNTVTDARKQFLVGLKEKCRSCSNITCSRCVDSIRGLCLMRLFHPTLPGYRPQPHRGGEYGDLSGQLTWNGRKLEMKAILKSNSMSRSPIQQKLATPLVSACRTGEEIIRQVVEQGLNDQRCGIIAVVIPQYIDANFKGTLRHLCRLGNKMITFWELDQLCQVLYIFKSSFADGNLPDAIATIP